MPKITDYDALFKWFDTVDPVSIDYGKAELFTGIDKGVPDNWLHNSTSSSHNTVGSTVIREPVKGSMDAFIPGVSYVATGIPPY